MTSAQALAASNIHQVGIVGGGQLAWMLLEAAQPLGLELIVQTPCTTDPALSNGRLGKADLVKAVLAPIDDAQATAQLAQQCQVITFENEFVDLDALKPLEAKGVCFRPGLSVLAALLDKYEQHCFLQSLGIGVPAFAVITPHTDLAALGLSLPVVIKSRRHGYDGQGTFVIRSAEALTQFWEGFAACADLDERFMVEAFVPFERELAIMAARSPTGEMALYPVVETYQQQQVCHWAIAPTSLPASIQTQIQMLATTLLESLDAIGIFGIELFLTRDGQVFVNEIAPRTHNSGHLTIDACKTSQFEQHLRAVCGLPLGNPSLHVAGAVMVNLLGFETAVSDYLVQRQRLAAVPNATVHWYGKTEAKPRRKLGHVTVLLDTDEREAAVAVAQQIESLWYPSA
jgi:5-(carboxyamino)imidazole ribonucleotide synthase